MHKCGWTFCAMQFLISTWQMEEEINNGIKAQFQERKEKGRKDKAVSSIRLVHKLKFI